MAELPPFPPGEEFNSVIAAATVKSKDVAVPWAVVPVHARDHFPIGLVVAGAV
jgi:hypothetical protein